MIIRPDKEGKYKGLDNNTTYISILDRRTGEVTLASEEEAPAILKQAIRYEQITIVVTPTLRPTSITVVQDIVDTSAKTDRGEADRPLMEWLAYVNGEWWNREWKRYAARILEPLLRPLIPGRDADGMYPSIRFSVLDDAVTAVHGPQSGRLVYEICEELFAKADSGASNETGW